MEPEINFNNIQVIELRCITGIHNKFYKIIRNDKTNFCTQHGRIGYEGIVRSNTYTSEQACNETIETLIKCKIKKGYKLAFITREDTSIIPKEETINTLGLISLSKQLKHIL